MATPEAPKEFKSEEVAPIDTKFDATAWELEKLEWDEPWKVIYLRESNDGNYSIYKYILASESWGNKWWIRKKFESQIGAWVEWTQFTDANGNELEQDWFKKWETVYLRVPEQKIQMRENMEASWERKIVKTETYHDSGWNQDVTKNIYDDGSWSTLMKFGHTHEYTEYYPNSNVERFYSYKEGEYYDYCIYDRQGKILYTDWWHWSEALDWMDEFDKYDEKGRLIYYTDTSDYYIEYDDNNNTEKITEVPDSSSSYKIVTVREQGKSGKILSKIFVGETWKEIDLMNWWIDKLIKDMHLEKVPYIYSY